MSSGKYGCYDKLRSTGYWVKDGQRKVGSGPMHRTAVQLLRWHEDTMSQECRYDMRATDARCAGCKVP